MAKRKSRSGGHLGHAAEEHVRLVRDTIEEAEDMAVIAQAYLDDVKFGLATSGSRHRRCRHALRRFGIASHKLGNAWGQLHASGSPERYLGRWNEVDRVVRHLLFDLEGKCFTAPKE